MKKWIGFVIAAVVLSGCSSSGDASVSQKDNDSASSQSEVSNRLTDQDTAVDNEKAEEVVDAEENTVSSEVTEGTAEDYGYHTVEDYSVYWQTEYAHITNDCAILGNDEKLTIQIEATPNDVDENDFIFYFENDGLTYNVTNVEHDYDQSVITIEITGDTALTDKFVIASISDFLAGDDEGVECVSLSVRKLDSEQGRVVYLSETGEKYHYSKSCLGGGVTTTLFDAEAYEYEPCQKCVN